MQVDLTFTSDVEVKFCCLKEPGGGLEPPIAALRGSPLLSRLDLISYYYISGAIKLQKERKTNMFPIVLILAREFKYR